MPTALIPLLVTLAASAPAIVATPANSPPLAPLATRCGPAQAQGGGSEVECLVEQPHIGGQATPAMRILIRTTPAAPCRALEAQAVAVPAASAPGRAQSLPIVVHGTRELTCAR